MSAFYKSRNDGNNFDNENENVDPVHDVSEVPRFYPVNSKGKHREYDFKAEKDNS
jgi:hypothetical protein